MYLSQALRRENNNLDVIRLLAACAVIYGHANPLVPLEQVGSDWIAQWQRFDYSSSLAVKVFFFLSGLVVTNSLLEKQDVGQFLIARLFRIWPGLLAVLLITALVIGPMVSTLPLGEYWAHPDVWSYISKGMLMDIRYDLPGVFEEHRRPAMNGSLWSIPYEVSAYGLLLALFLLGVHRARWLAVAVLLGLCLDSMLPQSLLTDKALDSEIRTLGPCFALGALLVLFKDKVQVTGWPVLGLLLLYLFFKPMPFANYLFYGWLLMGILYLCTRPWMCALRLPADISYGVYLWGWPVQQLVVYAWPEMDVGWHRGLSVAASCILGALSWYWLEKPAMALGRSVHAWSVQQSSRFLRGGL